MPEETIIPVEGEETPTVEVPVEVVPEVATESVVETPAEPVV